MPKRKSKRSAAQMESLQRGREKSKKVFVKRRSSALQEELYQAQIRQRKKELKNSTRCRATPLAVLVMLFLMIINCQLIDGLGRWKAVNRIASLSNKSAGRLNTSFVHYVKTGNILVIKFFALWVYVI